MSDRYTITGCIAAYAQELGVTVPVLSEASRIQTLADREQHMHELGEIDNIATTLVRNTCLQRWIRRIHMAENKYVALRKRDALSRRMKHISTLREYIRLHHVYLPDDLTCTGSAWEGVVKRRYYTRSGALKVARALFFGVLEHS